MLQQNNFLYNLCSKPEFTHLHEKIQQLYEQGFDEKRYGDLQRWHESFKALPNITTANYDITKNCISLTSEHPLCDDEKKQLKHALVGLHPWRKGPFNVFNTHIDTEWRSDIKWDRVQPHLSSLQGKTVLDVGCGSGYHCWRMRAAGASLVMGIEPSPLFVIQFLAIQKYIADYNVGVLPIRLEQLPPGLSAFDTVFSMGVLYHRRSPLDHLKELYNTLKPGGELVLETLVIDGDKQHCLTPQDRYAKMGNVWFIPSAAMLEVWLLKSGFSNPKTIDISKTTTAEQRPTEWMKFQSLQDFLSPKNNDLTVEGYPAPKRAIILAHKPSRS